MELTVIDKFTGERMGAVPWADASLVDQAVRTARDAFGISRGKRWLLVATEGSEGIKDRQHWDAANKALEKADFATYGEEMKKARDAFDRLERIKK